MIDFKSKVEGSILNLNSCNIIDQDILDVVKFIGENPQIDTLNLQSNSITAAGAKHIAASQTLQNLTNLNLQSNKIGDEVAKHIAASQTLQNLTNLNLQSNRIEDAGAKHIAASQTLQNLTNLNLQSNLIGAAGAVHIAASQTLKNLTNLDLQSNRIGAAGAEHIAASQTLQNLTNLDLQSNSIGNAGAKHIAASQTLQNLTNLSLGSNGIGDEVAEHIAASQTLKNLTNLNLQSNKIGDEVAKHIAASQTLQNLTNLSLGSNSITAAGFTRIAKLAKHSNLKIWGDEIGRIIIDTLSPAYKEKGAIDQETAKKLIFELAQKDNQGNDVKYFLDRPEEYPFLINSRNAEGQSLLYFYNNNPQMQQYLFEHGMIPEKEKKDVALASNSQGVHDKRITEQNHFITGQLVKSYGQKTNDLLHQGLVVEAQSYNETVKDLANHFSDVEIRLLGLTASKKKDTLYIRDANNQLKIPEGTTLPNDQEFVEKVTKKASEVLQNKYLNENSGYYTHKNAYNSQGSTITIPETIGLVNHEINNRVIPIADKKELLVTLFEKNPELVKDKLEMLTDLLGKEATFKNLTNRAKCHQLIENTDPDLISATFEHISGLDIDQTIRKQQVFELVEKLYWVATTYGPDNNACIGGTWTQIVNAAAAIEPKYLDEFTKVKEEEAAKALLKKDINPKNIGEFIESLAEGLVKHVKDKPQLKEALVEAGTNQISIEQPEKITIPQQQILGKINTIFSKEIKSYLPNYTRTMAKLEEYTTIINALPKSSVLEKFTKSYGDEKKVALQEEGTKIAINPRIKQLELQKRNLKQQFKTTSYDISDKLNTLSKDQLDEIKQKNSQQNLEGSKLKRSNSQSSAPTKNNWQDQVKRPRSNSSPRSPGS